MDLLGEPHFSTPPPAIALADKVQRLEEEIAEIQKKLSRIIDKLVWHKILL